MTQDDVNNGIVNVVVGFAPLKPAEFVIIKVQQRTGRSRADPYKNFHVIRHMKLENEGWERAKSSPPSRADPPAAS